MATREGSTPGAPAGTTAQRLVYKAGAVGVSSPTDTLALLAYNVRSFKLSFTSLAVCNFFDGEGVIRFSVAGNPDDVNDFITEWPTIQEHLTRIPRCDSYPCVDIDDEDLLHIRFAGPDTKGVVDEIASCLTVRLRAAVADLRARVHEDGNVRAKFVVKPKPRSKERLKELMIAIADEHGLVVTTKREANERGGSNEPQLLDD